MNKQEEVEQLRRTHIDTLQHQETLSKFLEERIVNPTSNISRKEYNEMIANALLGQGLKIKCRLKVGSGTNIGYILFADDLHNGLIEMREYATGDTMVVNYGMMDYTLDTRDVWKQLYAMCKKAYGRALSQALKMSTEFVDLTSGYGVEAEVHRVVE